MKKGDTSVKDGTIRIKVKDCEPVIKDKKGWKKTKYNVSNIKKIVKLYKNNKNLKALYDSKDKKFFKGHVTKDGKIGGEKINILPNKKELDKPFSIFAEHLTIHDDENNSHWDVMFQNPNKKMSYLYTKEKIKKSKKKKFSEVKEFEKRLPKLRKNLNKALKEGELMALPLYTLLKTTIRVGNKKSYEELNHKGLTTLKKGDIKVNKTKVNLNFIGKDGVPQNSTEIFSPNYAEKLVEHLNNVKKDDFVFKNKKGNLLKDTHFEDAFLKYSGKKFYPHIVRSFYATNSVEQFLEKKKYPTKEEIRELYNRIAEKLGHKKFSKKTNDWHPSYTITIAHYINPVLIEKIHKITSN